MYIGNHVLSSFQWAKNYQLMVIGYATTNSIAQPDNLNSCDSVIQLGLDGLYEYQSDLIKLSNCNIYHSLARLNVSVILSYSIHTEK